MKDRLGLDQNVDLRFGDYVEHHVPGLGMPPERSYVIGFMKYSAEVVLLADEQHIGMPINVIWCILVSRGHEEDALKLRKRYDLQYSDCMLKPLKRGEQAMSEAVEQKRFAPEGSLWVCCACGKIATDRYGIEGERSSGWDESCFMNSQLFDKERLVFEGGRVVRVKDQS